MKERYFTPNTIDDEAKRLIDLVQPFREKKNLRFKPGETALLVLDMQRYFLEPQSHAYVPSAAAVVPNIIKLQDYFKKKNLPIFQTRHINTPENAGQMKQWWRGLITPDNPLCRLIEETREPMAEILDKTRYDAFFNTDLEERLNRRGIGQLVITGVMTHLCCESTARSAFMRGFQVYFTVDGTATYNRRFHEASLLNLSHGFAVPMTADEIINRLNGKG
jgi:isochorismate hydrolase